MRTYGQRFDVNCSTLFTELAVLAGFDAVEFRGPFGAMVPADAFVAAIADAGVEPVSLNFHAGDMAAGERGLVPVPAAADAFRQNIGACVEIAGRTGRRRFNAAHGNRLDSADPAGQDAVAIGNLTLAAETAASDRRRCLSRRSTPSTPRPSRSIRAAPRSPGRASREPAGAPVPGLSAGAWTEEGGSEARE
jgi:hydroxypyruvate isomerase